MDGKCHDELCDHNNIIIVILRFYFFSKSDLWMKLTAVVHVHSYYVENNKSPLVSLVLQVFYWRSNANVYFWMPVHPYRYKCKMLFLLQVTSSGSILLYTEYVKIHATVQYYVVYYIYNIYTQWCVSWVVQSFTLTSKPMKQLYADMYYIIAAGIDVHYAAGL